MPRVKVDFCTCGQPKNHDEGSEFFVTCVREAGKPSQRASPILGPYATHGEALANVDRGRSMAEAKDAWSHFDAFGTVKTEAGKWKGVFGI